MCYVQEKFTYPQKRLIYYMIFLSTLRSTSLLLTWRKSPYFVYELVSRLGTSIKGKI